MRTFLFAFFIFGALAVQGQTASISATTSNEYLTNQESNSWLFHQDEEHPILYIDFEELIVNLDKIAVIDTKSGNLVFQDEVWGLPVDAIYELDLSAFPKGNYRVELRSLSGLLTKEIGIN